MPTALPKTCPASSGQLGPTRRIRRGLLAASIVVFGSAYCAECDALFRVDHAIVARWSS
ncbi:hypothetical protein SLAV_02190 [Streptomyces lavendulae subsp. lavendulae]|uniref:Uncharacterized protein n=1 Tax=Streptomyces lavendulae subsp. lavendulae TaxID=58340 RepID=A0A2K8P6I0_STRLA|nr:hypothetical protein SLAV_02190 [Streptomyces lavendulae subsp. lavendulae]QUQ52206.1 hypothetical protein SLLC_00220 [Streptomyces lavendulae subsp. lavendulae]